LERLRQLLDELPEDLRQQVFTHASWTDRRSDSYSRLAFLGDSVLGLAITAHLYPRLEAERVLASVIEAVIGACYLEAGYERTAEAVVEAFMPEIEHALTHPVDFKSTLQERLAQRGELVSYEVTAELGPPHDRTFEVVAGVAGRPIGTGSGRSKKHAEQEAARLALEMMDSRDEDDDE
jgi:ribonuclease III